MRRLLEGSVNKRVAFKRGNTVMGCWSSKHSRLPCHLIASRLKIVNYKKFDDVPQFTGGQEPSESLH